MHQTTELILKFIKAYKSQYDGCSPSYSQIREGCELASSSVVAYHMNKLAVLELIKLPEGRNDIEVVGGQWTMKEEA